MMKTRRLPVGTLVSWDTFTLEQNISKKYQETGIIQNYEYENELTWGVYRVKSTIDQRVHIVHGDNLTVLALTLKTYLVSIMLTYKITAISKNDAKQQALQIFNAGNDMPRNEADIDIDVEEI